MCHNSLPTMTALYVCPFQLRELLSTVGTKQTLAKDQRNLLLMLVGGRYKGLENLLHQGGYLVIAPTTSDQAVAVCMHNRISAAIIDESFLSEAENWSLAESLKAVSPHIAVVLLVRGSAATRSAPHGVDCVVSDRNPGQVIDTLKNCVPQ